VTTTIAAIDTSSVFSVRLAGLTCGSTADKGIRKSDNIYTSAAYMGGLNWDEHYWLIEGYRCWLETMPHSFE
jgi:hypothetical protein